MIQSLKLDCDDYYYFAHACVNAILPIAEQARRLLLAARRAGSAPIWFFRLF